MADLLAAYDHAGIIMLVYTLLLLLLGYGAGVCVSLFAFFMHGREVMAWLEHQFPGVNWPKLEDESGESL